LAVSGPVVCWDGDVSGSQLSQDLFPLIPPYAIGQ
jgi:hypothetical protein